MLVYVSSKIKDGLYSTRLSCKSRAIWTKIGKDWLFLEILENHQYHRSKCNRNPAFDKEVKKPLEESLKKGKLIPKDRQKHGVRLRIILSY